ncbi:MAG: nuclear transport factor 2 family protein [Usitatibacteraceae bacterium]
MMDQAGQISILTARNSVAELVYRSCMRLDALDFSGYLDMCDPAFRYRITAFSPEIRKEMIWLDHDNAGMQLLFKNLPKHNSDKALLTRHPTVYTIDFSADGKTASVVTGLQVFRTTLDGGATELFAVGKMHDNIRLSEAGARLLEREIKLDTRMLGIGFHIPF